MFSYLFYRIISICFINYFQCFNDFNAGNEKTNLLWKAFTKSIEKGGKTILHFAAETGISTPFKVIIKYIFNNINYFGFVIGLEKLLELNIKGGGNVNIKDNNIKSPLHYAAANGN